MKTPRGKRARLAREKKEKAKAKAKQKPEPLRKKDPNAPLKKTKRNFEPRQCLLKLFCSFTCFVAYLRS